MIYVCLTVPLVSGVPVNIKVVTLHIKELLLLLRLLHRLVRMSKRHVTGKILMWTATFNTTLSPRDGQV